MRLIIASVSLLFLISLPIAGGTENYPHIEVNVYKDLEIIESKDDTVTITIEIEGKGGRVEDLPKEIIERLPRKPIDVVLVIDKSGSMEATDYYPSRLEAAKEAAKMFVSQLKSEDRVAVVSFTGYATVDSEFTDNLSAVKSRIDSIHPVWKGTAIGEGIIKALELLENYGRKDSVKAIILLSDGENNRGIDPVEAASEVKKKGIPIFTVGIGTVEGTYLTGPKGKRHLVKLDEETLKTVAEITGGEYFYAPGKSELIEIYERLSGKVLNVAGLDVEVIIIPSPIFEVVAKPEQQFFRIIPVDSKERIKIQEKPKIILPGETVPVIERVEVVYTDLITGDVKRIVKGPIYIEFEGKVTPSEIKIRDVSFLNTDNSYSDTIVYRLSDIAEIHVSLDNPSELETCCVASSFEYTTGTGMSDTKKTSSETITHFMDFSRIGRYLFYELLYYPKDILTDYWKEEFYVVFDETEGYEKFSDADVYNSGDWKLPLVEPHIVKLHPKTQRILEVSTSLAGGVENKIEAIYKLAWNLPFILSYNDTDCDFKDDYTILEKGHGDCTDFTALYISLARSLNIPVRGVKMVYYDAEERKEKAHNFAEVFVNNRWITVEPQGIPLAFNNPDYYVLYKNYRDIECYVEYEPGKVTVDTTTTIKYAVTINRTDASKGIIMNLTKGTTIKKKIYFENNAKSTDAWWNPFDSERFIARNFNVEVIDAHGLDVKISGLSRDNILMPKETDYCVLEIKVPYHYIDSLKQDQWIIVPLKLKISYEATDGDKIEKFYTLKVVVTK